MCLFPDSQRACVLVTSQPLIPASQFTLRSLARPRSLLPCVSPAPVLYPVPRSRWSSSLSDNLSSSVLGCATGQCMLNYSRVIVEFMSQPGRRLLAIARREHMERAGVKGAGGHGARLALLNEEGALFAGPNGPVLDEVTRSALWSYQLGLQTGFMPIDLHDSVGVRAAFGVVKDPIDSVLSACRMVSGRLRGQWLALRRHLSFPSLRKLTLRAEDDDGFAPMAEIRAVLDRNARTLRHLDAVFQSSVIRTLTHLDLVDTRLSGPVLGRVAHAAALVSLTLHGTFEDVKGATVTFTGDHVLDEGEGGGRQHTLLPHLHSFRFLLLGHDDQHPLYATVATFLAHRPLLRRLDLGSCPWELLRSLLPTLGGLKVLGVRIAHFNSAAAQGLWGALPRGVHALHLTTVVAERDLLVFETLPPEILSFLRRTPFPPKPSPLPPSLGARVPRALASVAQRYKREPKASVAFGAHLSCILTRSSAPPPPFVNALVPFTCLVLPSAAWSRAGARGQRSVQRALVLPFAASSCGALAIRARKNHSSVSNEHAPALRAFPALAFLHLRNTATHRPKPNLVSEREFAQQTEGWHGEHYVVVRRTGERRRLDGRRENGEEGEAEEEVELKELPCRRHLDCGKGVDVGGEDATWLERKDVPIDYEMPVVS
ncbi:hypothetical protein B0H14DRAFT_3505300 [Mycena olivaceomarginata]|nr:hypothetical protein B0H14DRAFT_3505300 [Mycena olivaceomarginata]